MSPVLQGGRLRFAGVTVPVSWLGATVPPFPSPLRAPSLYKPCRGGGSLGGGGGSVRPGGRGLFCI